MKRLFVYSLLIFILCFASCRKTANISYAPASEEDDNTDILYEVESAVSDSSALSEDVLSVWASYADYTAGVPDPEFFTSEAMNISVSGVSVVVFTSNDDKQLNDLKIYLTGLEQCGFCNVVTTDGEDFYEGAVYSQSKLVFEYTYRYGTIVFDVFKNDVSIEQTADETSCNISVE